MSERLDEETRATVSAAFGAYNAMESTKRRHIDYLNMIEAKRKRFNLEASPEELDLLAALLADHNLSVSQFTSEAVELKRTDPGAHVSLFKYIGYLNEVFADSEAAAASKN